MSKRVEVRPLNVGREPKTNRTKTVKLLKAAERAPLDPRVGQNASRLRRLVALGYLERRVVDHYEMFFRTDKPYVVVEHDDTVFDVERHRRRFQE